MKNKLKISKMQHWLLIFLLCLFISCKGLQKHNNSLSTNNFITIFDSKEVEGCYRIPAVITALNGDIIIASDQRIPNCGDLRHNEDINIVIKKSSDNGVTWSETQTIVDYPLGQSASDPSFILDRETGDIFLFFNYMNLRTAKGKYYFKVIKSTDNGKSWSEPLDITKDISEPSWGDDFMFITSGRGIQTESGMLLHTLVNLQRGVIIFGSKDNGATWSRVGEAIKTGDESKIVELSNGDWMVNSRVNKLGMRYVHISKDEGKTWFSQKDTTLIDPSCNASLLRYNSKRYKNSGILIFSNLDNAQYRKNLTIKVSFDNGKSWSKKEVIYHEKAAYSTMSILKNGNIGLVFEKDDYQEIVFVELAIKQLLTTSKK